VRGVDPSFENTTGGQKSGSECGDIDLTDDLTNVVGPVPLVLDLRITHECWGSSSDPSLNGHLRYPNDIDRPLNETTSDKISVENIFEPFILTGHRETDHFFATSRVHLTQSNSGLSHFHRSEFSSHLKSKIGKILVKSVVLCKS
jgi:hypothetical protein